MEKRIKICEIKTERFRNIISVVYDDNTEDDRLGSYFPDELSFTPDEFVGLTEKEATDLMHNRDKTYLRS